MTEIDRLYKSMIRQELKLAIKEDRAPKVIPFSAAYEEWIYRTYKRKGIAEAQKRMEKDAVKATERRGYMPLYICKAGTK